MRKLMWFAIGFAVACGVLAYGMQWTWLPPAAGCVAVLAIAAVLLAGKRDLLLPAAAVLTGCTVGLLWWGACFLLYLSPVSALDGEVVSLSMTASDSSYDTGYGTGVDGITVIAGKPFRIRAYVQEGMELQPGDSLEGTFRLYLTLPEADRGSAYLRGNGIFLRAYQMEEPVCHPAQKVPIWCFPAVLRVKILELLQAVFPGDTLPFAKALLLGDGRDLDYETNTALRVSGIRHIVAVSGLHISILYGLICIVTLRRRYLTAFLGIPVLLLFAAVAGFTPSVVRACIMVFLMLLAMVFDREYDPATALAFAVLVILMVNPMAVTSVSLQLSVACVAGILLFNRPINRWLVRQLPVKQGVFARLWRLLCGSISVTVSAMSLATPLTAVYFGTVSLVGILTNLLTLWAVNLVFNGLVVVCIVYPLLPAGASCLAGLLSWPIRYVLAAAKTLASLPMAAVYTRSIYIVFWLVFVYVLLAVFLLMKKKKPGMLLCCGILGLCLALLASWTEPLAARVGITMLDVGQGQAVLLQSEGKTFLVDCGGDREDTAADLVAETLLSQGIRKLDGIILTHYDRDHAGGLHDLLTRVDTDYLFLPDTRNEFPVPRTAGQVVYVWEDMELVFGSAVLRIYGPVYSGLDNENSLCVLFDTENCDILVTGDRSAFGERMLMRRRRLPDVDILVAGHHGAADSTSEELLCTVTPETVLISVAEGNIYGHPAPALLERLEAFGCRVFRTDLNGSITIRR